MINSLKIFALTFLIFCTSCTKQDTDLSNLSETFFVRHKNADMPAHIYGNASEKVFLIILHGGPGGEGLGYRNSTMITEVEKNNAVVYFDQRGSGSSQGSYSEDDLSIELMAEDVLALAQVIRNKYGNDSKLFLMGHSWGGTLGPAVLLEDQNEFLGWIDVCGAHNHAGLFDAYQEVLTNSANEQIALGNSIEYWEHILAEVQSIDTYSIDNQLKLNRFALSVDDILVKDNIINEPVFDISEDTPKSNGLVDLWNLRNIGLIFDYQKGLNQLSYKDRLPEITIPSLVMWGKYDHTIPLEFAYEAYDHLGSDDKELFILERSAHGPMSTEPELFAEKLVEFINAHK